MVTQYRRDWPQRNATSSRDDRPPTPCFGEVHALALDGNGGLLVGAQRFGAPFDPMAWPTPVAGVGTLEPRRWHLRRRQHGSGERLPIASLRGVARAPTGRSILRRRTTDRAADRRTDCHDGLPFFGGYVYPRALRLRRRRRPLRRVLGRKRRRHLAEARREVTARRTALPRCICAILTDRPRFLDQPGRTDHGLVRSAVVTEFERPYMFGRSSMAS